MDAAGQSAVRGNDLTRVTVDDDGRLLWDGKPVVVRRKLQLSGLQKLWAIVLVLAALLICVSGATVAAIRLHDWMCGANWITQYCVVTPPPKPVPPPQPELPN